MNTLECSKCDRYGTCVKCDHFEGVMCPRKPLTALPRKASKLAQRGILICFILVALCFVVSITFAVAGK